MHRRIYAILFLVAVLSTQVQANSGRSLLRGSKKSKNKNKAPKGKSNAPGQRKKLPTASGLPAPHPKFVNAAPNAAFKRDILRDPGNNLYDKWKDEWKNPNDPDYIIFPSPPPPPKDRTPPGTSPSPTPSPPPSPSPAPAPGQQLTVSQRRRIESLTSIFEFSSTTPLYGYAENIGDGRGITFGRCGFCTGTGDGLMVVEEYVRRKPSNPLAKYLSALRRIDSQRSGESNGDTTGLGGFATAVHGLKGDEVFRSVQDWAHQQLYYGPSQRAAAALGLETPLSRGQLYDAYLMHGENRPTDSFYPKSANGMAAYVNKQLGGSPADGIDEKKWISAYLARRRSVLTNADRVWANAANRIDIYKWLANAGAWQMNTSIRLQTSSCGSDGVCSRGTLATVGPSVYGNFNIS